eukprot:3485221-Pyramimonas_sp.AAC.1
MRREARREGEGRRRRRRRTKRTKRTRRWIEDRQNVLAPPCACPRKPANAAQAAQREPTEAACDQ